jgi:hypothetical protein
MIHGFIIKNSENDFEIYSDIPLTEDEQKTIYNILENHINDGFSTRGTLEECFEDMI